MSEFKIIFVDDEESIRNLAAEVFEVLGYTSRTEADGLSAIESMKKEKFDILITDIKMPGIDGLELIRRAKVLNPDITTIIITGYGSLDTARMAIKEGAYDYILKPFDLTELKTAVNNAIEKKRLEKENIRLRELTELFRVSQALRTEVFGGEILKLLLTTSLAQSNSQKGLILLLDDEKKHLLTISSAGLSPEHERERYMVDTKIKLWIEGEEIPFIISDNPQHQEFAEKEGLVYLNPEEISIGECLEKGEKMLSFPLKIKEKFYGVINVIKKTGVLDFTISDIISIGIIANQTAIAIDNMSLLKDIQNAYYETVKSLALLLEAKDPHTHGHSERVGDICIFLGLKMGLSSKEIELLKIASALHDIGKIAISESLLNKPARLTDEEFKIIKKHPVIADEILKPLKFLENARPIIRAHHERYDGKGYPDGLDRETLRPPLNIIIAADALDAMNSSRPYREPLAISSVKKEFELNSGSQFDPVLVDLIIKYIENGELLNFIYRLKDR